VLPVTYLGVINIVACLGAVKHDKRVPSGQKLERAIGSLKNKIPHCPVLFLFQVSQLSLEATQSHNLMV
jgi:hypothetical protein